MRPVPKSSRRSCPPSGPATQMAPYKQGPDARLSAVAAVLPGPGPPLKPAGSRGRHPSQRDGAKQAPLC
ncbi:hypothetical protein [Azospirillum largimobile]